MPTATARSIKKLVEEFGQCCQRMAESLPHWEETFKAVFRSVMHV
jgi:hypothetical protein